MLTALDGAWTYSEDPSTTLVDEVRFLLQDTDPSLPLLTDLEVQFQVDTWMVQYDSTLMVAAMTAGLIASKFAGLVSVSADGVSVQVGDVSAKYADMAVRLRKAHETFMAVGGETDIENLLIDFQLDPSIRPLNFSVGGMDNPRAGLQTVNHNQGPSYSWEDHRWHS